MPALAAIERYLATAGVSDSNGALRVPFVFGSTLRQRYAGDHGLDAYAQSLGDSITASSLAVGGQFFTPAQAENAAINLIHAGARSEYIAALARTTFLTPVVMEVNASQLQRMQPKRSVIFDTHAGFRRLDLVDAQGRNNGVLSIPMSGSTGALRVPGVPQDHPEARAAARRHRAWLSFYALSKEPVWLPNTREPNEFIAVLATPDLPVPVSLIGHWERVHDVTVSADNPYEIQWANTFVVERSEPDDDEGLTQNYRGITL